MKACSAWGKWLVAAGFCCLFACGTTVVTSMAPAPASDGGGDAADGRAPFVDPTSSTDEGVELRLAKVLPVAALDSQPAGEEMEFLIVYLTLRNVSATTAIAATVDKFQLATLDGLVVIPDLTRTLTVRHGCRPDQLAVAGGALSCAIVFAAKKNTGTELAYRLPSGASLRVTLTPRGCNTLVQRGSDVPEVWSKDPPSQASQGPIELSDGTYVLRRVDGSGCSTGTCTGEPRGAFTLRVSAGRFEYVTNNPAPHTPLKDLATRASGTIEVADGKLTLNSSCGAELSVPGGFKRLDVPEQDIDPATSIEWTDHRFIAESGTLWLSRYPEYLQFSKIE